jgi:hypothetical protein
MTSETTNEAIADSLIESADSIDDSLLKDGHDLQELAAKTVYSTFYYFSYGVCFVGHLVGKTIPKDGVVGHGLRDGAAAAKESVDRITAPKSKEADGFSEPIELGSGDGEEAPAPAAKAPKAKKTAPVTKKARAK